LAQSSITTKFDPLSDQVAFPRLSDSEMAQAAFFGERCSFQTGELLVSAGQYPFHSYVILSGRIRVIDVSAEDPTIFIRYGAGHFTGDIDLFTRRPSIVTIEAETPVEALRLTSDRLREMFVQRVVLAERFWRSFQRKRELLLESNFRGLSVYGSKDNKRTLDSVELLFRNSVPHQWFDTALEENAIKLRQIKDHVQRYPVITLGQKFISEAPTRTELAEFVGLRRTLPDRIYDVVIVGSGPSGLGGGRLRRFRRSLCACHGFVGRRRPGRLQFPDRELRRLSERHRRRGVGSSFLSSGAQVWGRFCCAKGYSIRPYLLNRGRSKPKCSFFTATPILWSPSRALAPFGRKCAEPGPTRR